MFSLTSRLNLLHTSNIISRSKFPALWKCTIEQYCTVDRVKRAFKDSGIIPVDPMAIDRALVLPSNKNHPLLVSSSSSSTSTPSTPSTSTESSLPLSPASSSSTLPPSSTTSDSTPSTSKQTHCSECNQIIPELHPCSKVLELPESVRHLFFIPGSKTKNAPKRKNSNVRSIHNR